MFTTNLPCKNDTGWMHSIQQTPQESHIWMVNRQVVLGQKLVIESYSWVLQCYSCRRVAETLSVWTVDEWAYLSKTHGSTQTAVAPAVGLWTFYLWTCVVSMWFTCLTSYSPIYFPFLFLRHSFGSYFLLLASYYVYLFTFFLKETFI